ncbi:MAG: rod shape-determining protein MreD [Bacteroidetes bacterium]|nr:rod shape-determining protein MreD [Bacteroidota bacterium]
MNNLIFTSSLRFIGLVLFQGLLLQRFQLGGSILSHLYVIVFPVFIMLLPLRTPRTLLIFLGFLIGLAIDLFYDSPGLHASAGAFTGFFRKWALKWMAPRGGYNVNYSPTVRRYGWNWFFGYSAIMMGAHLFFYFSVEAFTFAFYVDIILNLLISFPISMLFVFMFMRIFNPLD